MTSFFYGIHAFHVETGGILGRPTKFMERYTYDIFFYGIHAFYVETGGIVGRPGATKKPAMKRPAAATVAYGETYGGGMPDPEPKSETVKKPRNVALNADGKPDLTTKYRYAPMQKKGSSAILRYDENGKKQICQVSCFNHLL